jgi:hypothetical protein
MTLTRRQTIGLLFFVGSLLPAYLIANWRYDAKLASVIEMFEKEQALHLSTDKLVSNCEKIAASKANPYDATHQICDQGTDTHARTEQAMNLLTQEKVANEMAWYRNFALSVMFFNLLALAIDRVNTYLKPSNS